MWLQYALDRDNNLVSVHDVKRGRSNIRCPYCQEELTAKKGKVKAHHFAHIKDTCDLSQNKNVNLPLYYGFNLILTPKQFKYLKIEHTDKLKKTDYYLNKPIRYQRVVNKNQKLDRENLQQTSIDFNIYCAQYQRVFQSHLYLLEIKLPDKNIYKIGVTSRDIEERISEIKNDLSKIVSEHSISLLGFWLHRGNIEYYFKYLYSEFNYPLDNLTEYFDFPDTESILKDLNSLETKKISKLETDIFDGQTANKFLLSEHIRQGMRSAKYNGIHIGRPKGETESMPEFLAKPKNKAIAAVLKKGLSLRQTAKETGASINTVRKVKAALENSSTTNNRPFF